MSDINLSKAVRSNLLSLQNTATMMGRTQERLATGNKVNSALDNPTNFFTAASLNSRASDMNALMDGMSNGIQTLEAADNGLTAITKNLESMQSTLRQARQDKSFQTASFALGDIDANDPDLGSLTLSGGAIGNPASISLTKTGSGQTATSTAKFEAPATAGKASIQGDVAVDDTAAQAGLSFTITFGGKTATVAYAADADNDVAGFKDAITDAINDSELAGVVTVSETGGKFKLETAENVDGDITIGGTDADAVFGTVPADPDDIQAGERTSATGSDGQYSLTINGKKITLDATTGADVDTAAATINTALGDGAKFEAFKDTGGKLGIRAIADDAGSLKIGGADANLFGTPDASGIVAGTPSTTLKFARDVDELVSAINTGTDTKDKVRASNDNGKLRIENLSTQDLTVEGQSTDGKIDGTSGSSSIDGNSIRADLAAQFNDLRDQLDKLADDASFNGINLLRGDKLTITFNETGTSSIDIQSKGEKSINSTNLNLFDIKEEDLDSDDTIDSQLAQIKTALNSVRSQSSAFGSNLSSVQNRQDFTKNMINTLQTGAANLTLADTNEEAANLLALQTRQQLSSTALSMASQSDQAVLRLF
jgi:flagellin-like hook-associated protein FlgL